MIISIQNEFQVGEIRSGLQNIIMRLDEDFKWKTGMIAHFWYKMPTDAGSYEFANGKVVEIKDMIWYPKESIMTIIHASGLYNHLRTEKEQADFLKHCGYSSLNYFKSKKTKEFQTRLLCLAPKWGEGELKLLDISRHVKNG